MSTNKQSMTQLPVTNIQSYKNSTTKPNLNAKSQLLTNTKQICNGAWTYRNAIL